MNDHPVQDLSDPGTVRKNTRKVKEHRAAELTDLKSVLDTGAGQRLVWRVLEKSKFMAPDIYTADERTAYNLGKRDIGLWLYNEVLAASPRTFLDMISDNLESSKNG